MPFPNPRVFTAFLNEYLYVRQFKWRSATGWLQSWVVNNEAIKTAECIAENRKFYNQDKSIECLLPAKLANLEGWIDLIHKLGLAGEKNLFFSATLHAIRTYAIKKIKESEYKEQYQLYITNLAKMTDDLKKQVLELMVNKATKEDVEKKRANYHENLIKLSNLGDALSICIAMDEKLFPGLTCPLLSNINQPLIDSLNENVPYFYHDNYYHIHYETYYRPYKQVSFNEFEAETSLGQTTINTPDSSKPSVFSNFTNLFLPKQPTVENPPGIVISEAAKPT